MERIPIGTWGGEHIRVEIHDDSATVEYDCAHGEIRGPVVMDHQGHFGLSGTHVRERHGPIRLGQAPAAQPAQYTGRVDGERMMLTVTLTDPQESVGTYTLVHGQPGRIWKCR